MAMGYRGPPQFKCMKLRVTMELRDHSPSFDELPAEILRDIFSRLPVTTIGFSRCVCRRWCSILNEPGFDGATSSLPSYLLVDSDESDLHLLESAPGDDDCTDVSRLCRIGRRDGCYNVLAAHGGFACHYSCQRRGAMYLCNPITGSHVELPPLPLPATRCRESVGIGFAGAASELLKLVRVSCLCNVCPTSTSSHRVQVALIHTLGTASWREVGRVPLETVFDPVACGGRLHWRAYTSINPPPKRAPIVTLDLASEEFRVEHGPEVDLRRGDRGYLVGLGGDLGFVVDRLEKVEVWAREEREGGGWCRRFSLATEFWWGNMRGPRFEIVGLWRDGVLLGKAERGIGCYDVESGRFWRVAVPCRSVSKALVHVGSLMSPRKLFEGGGCCLQ